MPAPHASKLACLIVEELYGSEVHKTFKAMVVIGRCKLQALLDASGIPYRDLRSHCLILLQHGLIKAYVDTVPGEQEKGAPPTTQPAANTENKITTYEADISAALRHLRFSKFSIFIQDAFGTNAQLVFEEFLEHGRLTAEQAITQTLVTYSQALSSSSGNINANAPSDDDSDARNQITNALVSVVKQRYIVRVPPLTASNNATYSQQSNNNSGAAGTTGTTGRSNKRKKPEPSAPPSNDLPVELQIDLIAPNEPSSDQPESSAPAPPGTTVKSGAPALTSDISFGGGNGAEYVLQDPTALWHINFDRFIQEFRNKSIIEYVSEKVNGVAGNIVRCLLGITTPTQRSITDPETAAVSVDKLLSRLNEESVSSNSNPVGGNNAPDAPQAQPQQAFTRESLCQYLDLLCSQEPPILHRTTDFNGINYAVCVGGITGALRRLEVESIISDKFGFMSCRMFRLLIQHKQLEQKQIAEFAMVPPKECRELLYNMLRSNYVNLQEVPRSADRNPTRTIFLWKVQLDVVVAQLIQEVTKTILNVKRRRASELKTSHDLIVTFETKPDTMTEMQHAQLTLLQERVDRLDKAIIQLDNTYAILHDY